MNDKKVNKVKELYNKYKEAKKDPRKRAGMKLLGYFIFFFILMLIAGISNNFSSNKNSIINTVTTTTTTKVIDSYALKQNKLLRDKYNINCHIKYELNEYKINGIIDNNIIEGYLEENSNIKKIVIKDNIIYDSNNQIELNYNFNKNYIDLKYIINLIKQSSAFIQDKDDLKTYLYEIDNIKIYIKTDVENIKSIDIYEGENSYLLYFDN